jgi:hypothetical protein
MTEFGFLFNRLLFADVRIVRIRHCHADALTETSAQNQASGVAGRQ